MSYTAGNWTVSFLTTDTVTTPKNIAVPDLKYSTDFKKTEDEPNEGKVVNLTTSGVVPVEGLRFARTDIQDIYSNTNIPASSKAPVKSGVRVLCEVNTAVQAVNSVSGAEMIVPLRSWVCVQVPNLNIINADTVDTVLKRAFAACFATGATTSSRIVEIARGSLLPE